MTVGCTAAMVGFCMYSHTKIEEIKRANMQPPKVISMQDEEAHLLSPVGLGNSSSTYRSGSGDLRGSGGSGQH